MGSTDVQAAEVPVTQVQLDDEVEPARTPAMVAGEPRAALHAIVHTPFDEAIRGIGSIAEMTRAQAVATLSQAASVGFAGAEVAAVGLRPEAVHLVWSPETAQRIGARHVVVAPGSTVARTHDGRIVESARTTPATTGAEAVGATVIAAAHAISAVDTMMQLAKIRDDLKALTVLIEADRLGELRGTYLTLQRALADLDPDRRCRTLEGVAVELENLQGRFTATARAKLEAIPDPMGRPFVPDVLSSKAADKRELREKLQAAVEDQQAVEFCAVLAFAVHQELGNSSAVAVQARALTSSSTNFYEGLAAKVSYLSRVDGFSMQLRLRALAANAEGGVAVALAPPAESASTPSAFDRAMKQKGRRRVGALLAVGATAFVAIVLRRK